MSRLVEVFCATQRHQKNKKQKTRNADKGSHGLMKKTLVLRQSFAPVTCVRVSPQGLLGTEGSAHEEDENVER